MKVLCAESPLTHTSWMNPNAYIVTSRESWWKAPLIHSNSNHSIFQPTSKKKVLGIRHFQNLTIDPPTPDFVWGSNLNSVPGSGPGTEMYLVCTGFGANTICTKSCRFQFWSRFAHVLPSDEIKTASGRQKSKHVFEAYLEIVKRCDVSDYRFGICTQNYVYMKVFVVIFDFYSNYTPSPDVGQNHVFDVQEQRNPVFEFAVVV